MFSMDDFELFYVRKLSIGSKPWTPVLDEDDEYFKTMISVHTFLNPKSPHHLWVVAG